MGQACLREREAGEDSEKITSKRRPDASGESGTRLREGHSRQREQQMRKPQGGMSWEPTLLVRREQAAGRS